MKHLRSSVWWRAQLQLVLPSLVVWNLVGLASTALFHRSVGPHGETSTLFMIGEHSGMTVVLGVLAAALGTRLFSAELRGSQGMYWRLLPVAPAQQFWGKVFFGAIAMAASAALHAGWFYSGAVGLLHDALYANAVDVTPSFTACAVTLGWMLLVFACSAYFAAAFDRPTSAWQAGLPGFLVGTVAVSGFGTLGGRLPPWVYPGLVLTLAIAGARLTWPRRAVVAGSPLEPLRATPARGLWPVLLAAQLLLVVVPWGALLDLGTLWPHFGMSAWLGNALLWCVFGCLCLPWIARDRRRLAWRGWRAIAGVAAAMTGAGYLLWRAVRPRDPRDRHAARSLTPVTIFTVVVGLWILVPLALGSLRVARLWSISVDDAGTEIVLDGVVVGRGEARGASWGRPVGSGFGWGTMYLGTSVPHEPGAPQLRLGELARALHKGETPRDRGTYFVDAAFDPEQVVELRGQDGTPLKIQSVQVESSERPFRVAVHLRLRAE